MANFGQNSSSNLQAVVKVQTGGCITAELARALQAAFVIEFPADETLDGRIDVLSASAVAQIVEQLNQDEDFLASVDQLIQNQISSEDFVNSVVASLNESAEFKALIESCLNTLISEEDFINQLTASIVQTVAFETAVQDKVAELVDVINGSSTGTLNSDLEATFTHSAATASFNVTAIITDTTGANFPTGIQLISKTATEFTLKFHGATSGDEVSIEFIISKA